MGGESHDVCSGVQESQIARVYRGGFSHTPAHLLHRPQRPGRALLVAVVFGGGCRLVVGRRVKVDLEPVGTLGAAHELGVLPTCRGLHHRQHAGEERGGKGYGDGGGGNGGGGDGGGGDEDGGDSDSGGGDGGGGGGDGGGGGGEGGGGGGEGGGEGGGGGGGAATHPHEISCKSHTLNGHLGYHRPSSPPGLTWHLRQPPQVPMHPAPPSRQLSMYSYNPTSPSAYPHTSESASPVRTPNHVKVSNTPSPGVASTNRMPLSNAGFAKISSFV